MSISPTNPNTPINPVPETPEAKNLQIVKEDLIAAAAILCPPPPATDNSPAEREVAYPVLMNDAIKHGLASLVKDASGDSNAAMVKELISSAGALSDTAKDIYISRGSTATVLQEFANQIQT